MIVCVSLNPAVDKYMRLGRLRRGGHIRVDEVVASAGGKGVNVAGVLRVLGVEVAVLGFFGGYTGDWIEAEIAREGIPVDAVRVRGVSRTAFVVVEDDGTETEIVESGPRIAAAELRALEARLRRLSREATAVVLSGSVPPGCPDDVYVRLIGACRSPRGTLRCPVLLDTSRAWLRAALAPRAAARPTLVKPNRREAEELLGRLASPTDITRALRRMARAGVALPLISDGAAGLWALAEGALWRARPPRLEVVNSVGSGDAAVAGLACGLAQNWPFEDTLRLAAACGAANVLTKECAAVRAADLRRLRPLIRLSRTPVSV